MYGWLQAITNTLSECLVRW